MNWAQLYTEYRAVMIEVAARGIRSAQTPDIEAADVVNETFAAVIDDPPPAVPDWRAFLVDSTLARLELVAVGLPERWCLCVTLDDVTAGTVTEARPAEDAAVIALRRIDADEIRQRILRVMDYMTDRQREITRLRLFEGRTVGEIAAEMNTSSSNISQIVIRCLAKLQPVLTQFDTVDDTDLERVRPPRRGY